MSRWKGALGVPCNFGFTSEMICVLPASLLLWEHGFPEGLDLRGSVTRTKPLGEPAAQGCGGV